MHICPGASMGNNDISAPAANRDFLLHPKGPSSLWSETQITSSTLRGTGVFVPLLVWILYALGVFTLKCARVCLYVQYVCMSRCVCCMQVQRKTPKLPFTLCLRTCFCIPTLTLMKHVLTSSQISSHNSFKGVKPNKRMETSTNRTKLNRSNSITEKQHITSTKPWTGHYFYHELLSESLISRIKDRTKESFFIHCILNH